MLDKEFKKLTHCTGSDHVATRGTEVAPGYMPDITVCDASGKLTFILESESKTDRKAFLGDLIKAEMYAEEKEADPVLIIVMRQFSNTTSKQIADHLLRYVKWLAKKQGGRLKLSGVQVLYDSEYQESNERGEPLASNAFKARGHTLPNVA